MDGFWRWDSAVVDVACDEHSVGPLVFDEINELIEDVCLVFGQVDAVEEAAQMPIGSMN